MYKIKKISLSTNYSMIFLYNNIVSNVFSFGNHEIDGKYLQKFMVCFYKHEHYKISGGFLIEVYLLAEITFSYAFLK